MAYSYYPYLVLRGRIFYYRQIILGRDGKKLELKLSLQTSDKDLAKFRCFKLASFISSLQSIAKAMSTLSHSDLKEIAREYLQDILAKSEETVYCLKQDCPNMLPEEKAAVIEKIKELEELRDSGKIDSLLASHSSHLYKLYTCGETLMGESKDVLNHFMMRASIAYNQMYLQMLNNRYDLAYTTDKVFADIYPNGLEDFDEDAIYSKKPKEILTYNIAVNKYLENKAAFEWTEKTKAEHTRVLRWFGELGHANRPLKFIKREHTVEFRDLLKRLPPNLEKRNKNFTFSELVENLPKNKSVISPNTLQRYYGAFYSFFKWAAEERYITENPLPKGGIVKRSDMKSNKRGFLHEELQVFFHSPLFTGCESERHRGNKGKCIIKDDQYWLPIVGYCTGMRIGEMSFLTLKDIKQVDNIWYFDVNTLDSDNFKKKVKTTASKRKVPIHPQLVKMGFIDYINRLRRDNPKGKVFSSIEIKEDGNASDSASKKFSRYLEKIGIKNSQVSFHSFRHNFTDLLAAADIQDSKVRAIIGHVEDSVTFSVYSKGYSVSQLMDAVSKVQFDVDSAHLFVAHD